MASNALANIAAAVTAGYKEEVTDRGLLVGVSQSAQVPARFLVKLSGYVVGQPGNAQTGVIEFVGEGATQAAAETVALANLNFWRANRYGSDSAGVNVGTVSIDATTPSTQAAPVTLRSLTKDKH